MRQLLDLVLPVVVTLWSPFKYTPRRGKKAWAVHDGEGKIQAEGTVGDGEADATQHAGVARSKSTTLRTERSFQAFDG